MNTNARMAWDPHALDCPCCARPAVASVISDVWSDDPDRSVRRERTF